MLLKLSASKKRSKVCSKKCKRLDIEKSQSQDLERDFYAKK